MALLLLAQQPVSPSWTDVLSNPSVMPFFVGAIAVVGGIAFAITKAVIRHRERMAMIEHGIDPDDSSRNA
jgi:hypothetical protein